MQVKFFHHNETPYLVPSYSKSFLKKIRKTGGHDLWKLRKFLEWSKEYYPETEGAFYDIGANIGTTIIPALKELKCPGVAVEPVPHVCQLLRANLALNGLHEDVWVFQAAIGDRNLPAIPIDVSPKNCGNNRVDPTTTKPLEGCQRIYVPMMTFDELFVQSLQGQIGWVWIDAEGMEGLILSQAEYLHLHSAPVFMEFCPAYMVEPEKTLKLLVEHWTGFIDVKGSPKPQPIANLRTLYQFLNGKPFSFTDVFLIR